MDQIVKTAEKIRGFNRFYLPYFNLLTQKYLNSKYSIAEARILYEIYDHREISARDIVNALHVDKGYLSRILKKFEAESILEKKYLKRIAGGHLFLLQKAGRHLQQN